VPFVCVYINLYPSIRQKSYDIELNVQAKGNNIKRNASDTHFKTHFSTHSVVKILMGPIKSCGSHINLVGNMNFNQSKKVCVKM